MFEESFRGLGDLVLPGTSYLERDGTTVNLEGRLQRQRRAVIAPCPDELAWIAKLAERFGVELSPHASLVFDEVSATCYGGIPFGEVGEHAALPARARGRRSRCRTRRAKTAAPRATGLRLARPTGRSSPAPPSSARPSSQFQRPGGEIELAPRRRARARDRNGRHRHRLARTARRVDAARADRARPRRRAPCASPRGDAGGLHDARRGDASERTARGLVDLADQGRSSSINLVMVAFAYTTWLERKAARPDAAPLRPEPRRPVRACSSRSPT